MPRHWNGSEWVTFEKVQHGMPLHHDEKGAKEHNEKLKKHAEAEAKKHSQEKEDSLVETESVTHDPAPQEEPVEDEEKEERHEKKHDSKHTKHSRR